MITLHVVKQISYNPTTILRPSTVVAVPVFAAGPAYWAVTLGPSVTNESVLLLGAEWDAVNNRWLPCDPLTVVWEDTARITHFMRRDFIHAVCSKQIFECVGAASVHLTLF